MRSILIILFGAACYGLLPTFVKMAYQAGFSVKDVTGAQNLFGFIMMLLIWLLLIGFNRRAANKKISLKSFLMLVPIGIAAGSTGILYYSSLQYIPASIAIIFLFQFTWIGVLLEAILDRKLPGKEKLVALVLVLVGTLMESGIFENGWSQFSLMGIVFGLLAAICYGLYITLSAKVAVDVHPISRTVIIVFV